MYRIGIVNLEKIETLRELTNEFMMPSEYEMFTIASKEGSHDADLIINENGDLDLEGAKRELFFNLVEKTGYRPAWGTLTGVRPVKLTGELIEAKGEIEAKRLLLEYYLLNEDKTKTVMDMYKYQVESLGKPEANSVSLYIGIPFCPTRCLYCSFASNQVKESEIDRYIPALIKEMEAVSSIVKERGYSVESLYIGGGTPTTLNQEQMKQMLEGVDKYFHPHRLREFTVEAGRPDTIDRDKLNLIKDYGAGRISINPQTMKDRTLALIGRLHTTKDIEAAFEIAKEVGFNSINCDVIAGLPEENLEDMKHTLEKVYEMGADNITIHSLAVKRASRLNEENPNYHYEQAKITSEMIDYGDEYLKSKGFLPYYLYRQKHMAGSGENTGYCIPGKEGLYNVRIMDEHQTIIAMGAGGITKFYHPENNRLERVPNVTNYEQYIDRIDEMIGRKRNAY